MIQYKYNNFETVEQPIILLKDSFYSVLNELWSNVTVVQVS